MKRRVLMASTAAVALSSAAPRAQQRTMPEIGWLSAAAPGAVR